MIAHVLVLAAVAAGCCAAAGTVSSTNVEWPVFFEQLGFVHSIHNKWDLALRVHVNLPLLDVRVIKIVQKLDQLGAEAGVLTKRKRAHEGQPQSRLDDLNESWVQQNRHLRARCTNLQRRSLDLRQLGQSEAASGEAAVQAGVEVGPVKKGRRYRGKRQILQGLFGVAYASDVENVRSTLSGLDSRLSVDIEQAKTSANNIQATANQQINNQNQELRKVEDMAGKLERKVISMETNPFMRTSISDLVHVRNEAYKKIALEVDLMEERLIEIENMVTALGSGRLSKSVIAPRKLRDTLMLVQKQLPANYSLLFSPDDALWPYYSMLGANAVFDQNVEDVMVTISIPLVDMSSVLELNRVHSLPIKVKDGYSVVADVNTEYLVTDPSKQYFLELYKNDFQDCQVYHYGGAQQFFCGLSPMLRADRARSCVMQLFQGMPDPAWCQTRLKPSLVQPYTRLYNGSWVYSAINEQVSVVLECPDGKSPTELTGFGVISLAQGCTITSEEFWYAHTYAGMMETSIGFGDDDWSSSTESEGRDDDYDINNFLDDILFQEDLATESAPHAEALVSSDAATDTTTTVTPTTPTTSSGTTTPATTTASAAETPVTTNVVSEVTVQGDSNKESVTAIYKDLLVRLKDAMKSNFIIL